MSEQKGSMDELEPGDIVIWRCKKDNRRYKVTVKKVINDFFLDVEFPYGTRQWVKKSNCEFFSRSWSG